MDIRLTVPDGEPEGLIEPMLLAPFVENAFKHGAGMVNDPFIYIGIKVEGPVLFFSVTNNYHGVKKEAGIGLANIRSRLELLYPERHRLIITDNSEIYTVDLKLVLS